MAILSYSLPIPTFVLLLYEWTAPLRSHLRILSFKVSPDIALLLEKPKPCERRSLQRMQMF